MKLIKTIELETDMLTLGGELAAAITKGAVIYLHGELGAGKTTLTRGFLQRLGHEGKVKSPTYTLVEPYELAGQHIFHFDLYRLNTAQELEHIGIHDYFFPGAICLIEWPQKGFPLLPPADLACYIEMRGKSRNICIEACTLLGETILSQLKGN